MAGTVGAAIGVVGGPALAPLLVAARGAASSGADYALNAALNHEFTWKGLAVNAGVGAFTAGLGARFGPRLPGRPPLKYRWKLTPSAYRPQQALSDAAEELANQILPEVIVPEER